MTTTYKLVFAGPAGAGKTTAIQSLSDIDVVRTEASAGDNVRQLKKTTTVAMDYGVMKLDSGDQVHLYGTPGQKRFDFMWDILAENARGLVLMLRANAADPVADLHTYVKEFRELIDKTSLAVGITHADQSGGGLTRSLIAAELDKLGLTACVMDTDARERAPMTQLVKALICGTEPFHGSARR